ncbi:cyclic nucleotide-binding domain-containing protein [Marmoricola sp. RAF53]|uniref:cyclic nucleotide-binding domain-containing protein n=1 Tax=Marmoricola sp. RAF53 TaxID=3233059 RepID=UPI003F9CED0A
MTNRFMTSGDPAPRGDVRAEMRLLGAVPTFREAPAALLAAMVDVGHVVRVRPSWALLAEGTAPDKAYVLLEGEVDVRRDGVELGRCRPGEILGELGILRHRLRSATVVTPMPVTVLHLDRADFERLLAGQPYFRDLVGEAALRKSA